MRDKTQKKEFSVRKGEELQNPGGGKGPLLRDVEEKNRDSSLDEYMSVVESRVQQEREHRAEEQNRGKREMKPQEMEEHRVVKWKNETEVVGQKFPAHYMQNTFSPAGLGHPS